MSNTIRYLQRSRQAVLPGSRRASTHLRTKSASFGLLHPGRASVTPVAARREADPALDLRRAVR